MQYLGLLLAYIDTEHALNIQSLPPKNHIVLPYSFENDLVYVLDNLEKLLSTDMTIKV